MHHHIHTEEGEQEPNGWIAIEMALHPNMTPSQFIPIPMQLIREQHQYAKIKDTANGTPSQIGDKQAFELVLQEETGWCGNAFVEITCLEEKEADEEEGPRHQLVEPKRATSESTHTYAMQDYHPKNA